MKCVIVYFSQTGNTEKIARAIQSGIKKTVAHCDLIPIKDADPKRLYKYDLIGIGCPIFELVEPGNVKAFINNMRFVGGKHAFVFSTHGCIPDYFPQSIIPRLKKKGLIVIGTQDWYGNCHLPPMPEPYPTAGHPDETDLKEAENFGAEMIARSLKISAGDNSLIPPDPPVPPPPPRLEDLGFVIIQDAYESHFKFHEERCRYPGCHLCMDNCPMDGIDLSIKPPIIAKPCIQCTFCARICPTGAIDIDEWVKAQGEVNEKLMRAALLPFLDKAEAEGRFRRLVAADNIGFKTPVYKTHIKHPQWIIGKGIQ